MNTEKLIGAFSSVFVGLFSLAFTSSTLARTGIICTLENECSALHAIIDQPIVREVAQRRFILGFLESERVILVKSPMGKSENALTATLLAQTFRATRIVSMGTAGSLTDQLGVGSILMASTVFAHDEGRYLNIGFVNYRTKPKLEELSSKKLYGKTVFKGVLASGDQFIAVSDKARLIRSTTSADAVDTNSIAIKTACDAFKMNCTFFRYISDEANEMSPTQFESATRRNMKGYVDVVKQWIVETSYDA